MEVRNQLRQHKNTIPGCDHVDCVGRPVTPDDLDELRDLWQDLIELHGAVVGKGSGRHGRVNVALYADARQYGPIQDCVASSYPAVDLPTKEQMPRWQDGVQPAMLVWDGLQPPSVFGRIGATVVQHLHKLTNDFVATAIGTIAGDMGRQDQWRDSIRLKKQRLRWCMVAVRRSAVIQRLAAEIAVVDASAGTLKIVFSGEGWHD